METLLENDDSISSELMDSLFELNSSWYFYSISGRNLSLGEDFHILSLLKRFCGIFGDPSIMIEHQFNFCIDMMDSIVALWIEQFSKRRDDKEILEFLHSEIGVYILWSLDLITNLQIVTTKNFYLFLFGKINSRSFTCGYTL